ncbi:MAG: hypothetical protein ACRYFR_03980 [Janthinobacterium lividum]
MTQRLLTKLVWLLLGPLGLASCAVYMPMQCAAPAVQNKGQAELTGSFYVNRRLEFGANYSPVRHLLVRAAGGGMGDKADSSYYRGTQYEVAVGTYWPLGKRVLVGALSGYGQAHSEARYKYSNFLFAHPTQYQIDARFNKLFGEAYTTVRLGSAVSLGLAYRLTRVQFTSLTDLGGPVNVDHMLRSEPMFFVRGAFGSSARGERPVYAQFGVGTSQALNQSWNRQDAGPEAQVLQPRTYFTLGLGLALNSLFQRP